LNLGDVLISEFRFHGAPYEPCGCGGVTPPASLRKPGQRQQQRRPAKGSAVTRSPESDSGSDNEYVAIVNRKNVPVVVRAAGWKLRYSDASANTYDLVTIPVGTVIPALGHYLAVNLTGFV